jgi:hypothetical protein
MRYMSIALACLSVFVSASYGQTCSQPFVLRQENCPAGISTCQVGGNSTRDTGALTWQDWDRDVINTINLCNGPGRFTWPSPAAGVFTSNGSGTLTVGDLACTDFPVLTGDGSTSAGSCAFTLASSFKGWTDAGTTISNTTLTDKVGIGTSAPDVLLSINANAVSPTSPITGTLLDLTQVDSSTARLSFNSFGATGGSLDFKRANGTAASPSGIGGSTDTIVQIAGFGHDATSMRTSASIQIQGNTDGTWSSSSTPTAWAIKTTKSSSTTLSTVLTIDNAGHFILGGTAPSISCTGTGTSPSAPTCVGNDKAANCTINTGTGSPGSTGTCTITFASTYANISTTNPVIVCMPVKGATAWGNGATIHLTTESQTAPVLTWTNLVGGVATALTVSTSYKFNCFVVGI